MPAGIDRAVDRLLDDLAAKRRVDAATQGLKRLGHNAVPRLLDALQDPRRSRRTLAFYGLQFCWDARALPSVTVFLADPDAELRRMAAIVLVNGAGFDALTERCVPLLGNADTGVAAFALHHVESERPDLARTRGAIADPVRCHAVAPHLPRYHAPDLIDAVRDLAVAPFPETRCGALVALIHLNADDLATRRLIFDRVTGGPPAEADLAADYLLWHAAPEDRSRLETLVVDQGDPLLASGLAAALTALARRPDRRPCRVGPCRPPPADGKTGAFTTAAHPSHDPAAAWHTYRCSDDMEPHWAFRGAGPPADLVAERRARHALQARLFAMPQAGGGPTSDVSSPVPPPDRYAVPVRGYALSGESNYGRTVPDGAVEGFIGLVHVGDDIAWRQPHAPVFSVAVGVVRLVTWIDTWGTLVVIEHRDWDGAPVCSLYGHLSPFVCVRAGDGVCAGTKIGAVGRSYTVENGGYEAHLHFALHAGRFVQPPAVGSVIDLRYRGSLRRARVLRADGERTEASVVVHSVRHVVVKMTSWTAGYVSRAWWDAGDHGWLEPTRWLAARVTLAAGPGRS